MSSPRQGPRGPPAVSSPPSATRAFKQRRRLWANPSVCCGDGSGGGCGEGGRRELPRRFRLLFPRALRPHVRACLLLCAARRRARRGARGRPPRGARQARVSGCAPRSGESPPGRCFADVQPTVREFDLPRRAVPPPDRGEPDGTGQDLGVRDVGGREALLRALGGPVRPPRARRAAPPRRPGARRGERRRSAPDCSS